MKFLRVTLRLAPPIRHPMQEFVADSDAVEREEMWAWTMVEADVDRLLFYVVGETEPYARAIRDLDSILEVDITPAGPDGFYAYVVQRPREPELGFRDAFVGFDVVVVPPVVYGSDGDARLTIVGDPGALQGVVDALPESVVVEVERIGEYDHHRVALAGSLTDRQREAVRVAVEAGYYAVPREADLAAVAAELGVAESTASTLLRRAEAAVMERVATRTR
jgi:hypothetical protein